MSKCLEPGSEEFDKEASELLWKAVDNSAELDLRIRFSRGVWVLRQVDRGHPDVGNPHTEIVVHGPCIITVLTQLLRLQNA